MKHKLLMIDFDVITKQPFDGVFDLDVLKELRLLVMDAAFSRYPLHIVVYSRHSIEYHAARIKPRIQAKPSFLIDSFTIKSVLDRLAAAIAHPVEFMTEDAARKISIDYRSAMAFSPSGENIGTVGRLDDFINVNKLSIETSGLEALLACDKAKDRITVIKENLKKTRTQLMRVKEAGPLRQEAIGFLSLWLYQNEGKREGIITTLSGVRLSKELIQEDLNHFRQLSTLLKKSELTVDEKLRLDNLKKETSFHENRELLARYLATKHECLVNALEQSSSSILSIDKNIYSVFLKAVFKKIKILDQASDVLSEALFELDDLFISLLPLSAENQRLLQTVLSDFFDDYQLEITHESFRCYIERLAELRKKYVSASDKTFLVQFVKIHQEQVVYTTAEYELFDQHFLFQLEWARVFLQTDSAMELGRLKHLLRLFHCVDYRDIEEEYLTEYQSRINAQYCAWIKQRFQREDSDFSRHLTEREWTLLKQLNSYFLMEERRQLLERKRHYLSATEDESLELVLIKEAGDVLYHLDQLQSQSESSEETKKEIVFYQELKEHFRTLSQLILNQYLHPDDPGRKFSVDEERIKILELMIKFLFYKFSPTVPSYEMDIVSIHQAIGEQLAGGAFSIEPGAIEMYALLEYLMEMRIATMPGISQRETVKIQQRLPTFLLGERNKRDLLTRTHDKIQTTINAIEEKLDLLRNETYFSLAAVELKLLSHITEENRQLLNQVKHRLERNALPEELVRDTAFPFPVLMDDGVEDIKLFFHMAQYMLAFFDRDRVRVSPTLEDAHSSLYELIIIDSVCDGHGLEKSFSKNKELLPKLKAALNVGEIKYQGFDFNEHQKNIEGMRDSLGISSRTERGYRFLTKHGNTLCTLSATNLGCSIFWNVLYYCTPAGPAVGLPMEIMVNIFSTVPALTCATGSSVAIGWREYYRRHSDTQREATTSFLGRFYSTLSTLCCLSESEEISVVREAAVLQPLPQESMGEAVGMPLLGIRRDSH